MKLKNTLRKFLLLVAVPLLTLTLMTACGDDDDDPVTPPPSDELNLVELAQSDEDFSILVDIIVDLGLEETLAESDFTVFAPTNDAFEALPDGVLDNLTDEQKLDIIQFHVTEGSVPSSALDPQQDVTMLNEERTLVQSSAAGVVVNGSSNVVEADLEATNGYIHAIDEVLLPRDVRVALEMPSLVEVAEEAGNFETLLTLAEDAGLTTTLQFLGPYTAFAPNDDAFANLGVDPGTLTTEQLQFILTYHVISGAEIASGDLQAEQTVASAAEENLYITSGENGVFVNGSSEVITPDIDDATNGIIHVVDSVLLPNAFLDITGIAQKNYDLSTLVGLLVDNNLVETLQGDGPFTVFAPTNDAFEAIEGVVAGLTPEEVVEVLTYHVLADNVESGDLDASQTVQMLNEQDVDITVDGDVVTIEDASGGTAEVTVADQIGTNGVVHIIDAVLIPNLDGGNGGGGDQAVTLPVTFEDSNVNYDLVDFGGNISEIVEDPTDATNTVAQSTKGSGSEVWAGTTVGGEVGFENPIPFTETETTMSVRVWSPTAGTPIRLKVEDATDGGISVETEVNTTVAQEWETLVFDFSNEATGAPLNLANVYDKASIFFNFGTSGSDEVYYWDDIEFGGEATGGNGGGGGDITEPTSPAPTPPARNEADVISIYSDAYTDIGVTTFETDWSEGTEVEDIEIVSGDFIKLYDIGNFIGIQLDDYIDLTDFTHMHFDYWVADESVDAGAVFNPKLSNHANQDGETGAIGSVNEVSTTGEWVSFDVALDDFTDEFGNGVLDRDSIYQIVMTTSGTVNNVYIDNLYFYKE
ncbi:fasciclin domain-containing protein [Rhodohalobacter barkolensis]|uniref:FAS1 domain-containing protein n=1 Tax=Rhodohalobacter barkolensis TaxID=2053187 RepID=A0A2N0VKL5_9BACT|nr:fasciclin domain-containing protein [Rhodohalobacter barkolensis]PKD44747.1 hypothetical protein CWD77_04585 [Rhodohalobacter barkolensis]